MKLLWLSLRLALRNNNFCEFFLVRIAVLHVLIKHKFNREAAIKDLENQRKRSESKIKHMQNRLDCRKKEKA